MTNIFGFGETHKDYKIKVFNEREIRAAAGILFLFAILAFMNSFLLWDFFWTKLFVTYFLFDFIIRLFINPKFSPSIILGRYFVQNQKPEYVGAPQKKFAWTLGFLLGLISFVLLVIFNIVGPINAIICFTCLPLLFSESVLGICLGCKVYGMFNKTDLQLCPGNVCKLEEREEIQNISYVQYIILLLAIISVILLAVSGILNTEVTHLMGH